MKYIFLLLIPLQVWANAAPEYRLATGQGTVVPSVALLATMNRGFVAQNAAGVMYQDGFAISAGMAKNVDTDIAVEAGYAGKNYGAAAGMFKPGCSGCKGPMEVDVGMAFEKTAAVGLHYAKTDKTPTYGLGVIFNQAGTHRLGLVFEREMPEKPAYSITRYGGGYAYVTKGNTIALEVSKAQSEDPAATQANKIMTVSLGYVKRVDPLMVSITYETRSGDTSKPNDTMWMGAGFDSQNWNLSIYVSYRQQMMAVLAAYF